MYETERDELVLGEAATISTICLVMLSTVISLFVEICFCYALKSLGQKEAKVKPKEEHCPSA